MNTPFAFIIDRLVEFSPFFWLLFSLWAAFMVAKYSRRDSLVLPVRPFLTWLLLVMANVIIFASLLGGGGHLVDRLIGNPGRGVALAGVLVGSVMGVAVGWVVQQRTTL